MTSNTVLITGGVGFVGRALVGLCLAKGHSVAVYDNLQVGRLANLESYQGQYTFFQEDIRDASALDKALESFKPEVVIHLAALHFIPYCNAHPQETIDVNVAGTFAVLSACVRHAVKSVVFASSGALYASETCPLDEERNLPAPVDVYGLSKLLGEQTCHYFSKASSLTCWIARLFNTYGPFETNAHILPDIIQQLHQSDVLELGNLEPKRDYIYVDDTAVALYALSQLKKQGCDAFNVGTGKEYSVRELIDVIAHLTGRALNVRQTPERIRKTDKLHQIADVNKLERQTGFVAHFGITEGLEKLLYAEGLLR
jgi:UDP-glucose 4-epimerase